MPVLSATTCRVPTPAKALILIWPLLLIDIKGVPVESKALHGLDSLLAIVQMPGGVPVGTLAIGKPGAINAALLATTILGGKYPKFRRAYETFRRRQTDAVLANGNPA